MDEEKLSLQERYDKGIEALKPRASTFQERYDKGIEVTPSYLVGPMFHGTRVGNARLISGFRPDGAPKQEPVLRTSFNVGGTKTDTYPRRFGPGLYVTNNLSEATTYSRKDNKTLGTVIEGDISPDNPFHTTEEELDAIGFSKSSKDLVGRISQKPNYTELLPRDARIPINEAMDKVKGAHNFNEVTNANDFTSWLTHLKAHGETHTEVMPVMHNNHIVTPAHRAAANLQIRSGHDYMHITQRTPWGPDNYSDYGVVLRPNLRGYPAIFKARKLHFLDSIERSKNT